MKDTPKREEKVEFRPPEGFAVPEGTEAGKHFDLVCTFEAKPDGSLCMVKLGDTNMPGYDEDDEKGEQERHRPDYSQYSKGLMQEMGEGGGGVAPSPAAGGY